MAKIEETVTEDKSSSLTVEIIGILSEPLNLVLLSICLFLLYLIFKKQEKVQVTPPTPQLPAMKRRDMTYTELKKYDGTGEDGRVCVAVNGKVFDVTKGKRFYGPGGPYASFAGRDATRCLAMFSVEVTSDDYDDLSDLNSMQMDSVREWEIQFQEKYHYVGRLLKPGEDPTDYSDEEDTSQDQSSTGTQSNNMSSKKEE
ncbi:membrane-associated progesterone receptor component 1-like [Uloborus diversus]|uniref:membrane-associated progesterone receptor component 1-like n=1 Tax=Uloborus diversus TaxID=327109 RepID=UPI002409718B|nr:membrane-associated progesterone receptor component 1-like [Uloborus diversus]